MQSIADKLVLLIFPVQWAFYALILRECGEHGCAYLDPRWYALAYLAVAQLLAAGFSGLLTWTLARGKVDAVSYSPSSRDNFFKLPAFFAAPPFIPESHRVASCVLTASDGGNDG